DGGLVRGLRLDRRFCPVGAAGRRDRFGPRLVRLPEGIAVRCGPRPRPVLRRVHVHCGEDVMELRVTTPAPRDVWAELCRVDPDALVSQSPEWVDCLCELDGHRDVSRFYESGDGMRVVVPLVRKIGPVLP